MHTIRLRGPWNYLLLDAAQLPIGEHHPIRFPTDWSRVVASGTQRVRWFRRFHAPTGISPHDRIWIFLENVTSIVRVTLNENQLPPIAQASLAGVGYEASHSLQVSNELMIENEITAGIPCEGSVSLKIGR